MLLKDRILDLLLGKAPQPEASPERRPMASAVKASTAAVAAAVSTRQSLGLEQFLSSIRDRGSLNILDLSGANQANISFLTGLGHRLSSEDMLRSLDLVFGEGDFYRNQADPERANHFAAQTLDFPDEHFDGALVWDVLQYLSPPILETTVQRLARVLRPGAYLLSFFHSDEKAQFVPSYSFRIQNPRTLQLVLRGQRRPAQYFNNRALEKLFQRFDSVKFFLTREHIREVIVRR